MLVTILFELRVEQRCGTSDAIAPVHKVLMNGVSVPTGLQVSCQVKRRGPNALRHCSEVEVVMRKLFAT